MAQKPVPGPHERWWRWLAALVVALTAGALTATTRTTTATTGATPAANAVAPVTTSVREAALGAPATSRTVLPLSEGHRLAPSWPRPGPMAPAPGDASRPPQGADEYQGGLAAQVSANWSGYVDSGEGADFTQVSASWTVPAVGASTPGDSATWVGIDGFTNGDLVQAGTDQSHGTYYAWYELIPQYAFSLGPVNAGDRVYVDVSQDVPGTWTVTVEDITKGVTWTGPVAYYASGASAEWVEEAPTTGRNNTIETLADFASVQFTGMTVSGPGTTEAQAVPVYLVNGHNRVRAYPSQYDPVTDSLQISYGSPPGGIVGYPPATIINSTAPPTTTAPAPAPHGYWLAESDGDVIPFGRAVPYGSLADLGLSHPVTGMAATPGDAGYWLATSDGGVFAFGDAGYYGSVPGLGLGPAGPGPGRRLSAPIVGMAATPDGGGYYLVSEDGGVFAFGDARYYGTCATAKSCGAPAVAIVTDASGRGYWLLLANAQMVPFGDAARVSDGDCQDQAAQDHTPAVAAAPTIDGYGYWVVLQDGTTCAEGDAVSQGIWESQGPTDAANPAVAIITDKEGQGAWLAMSKGNVDRYGDAPRLGDLNGQYLPYPVVAAAGF